jgi:micrococcal nuclease
MPFRPVIAKLTAAAVFTGGVACGVWIAPRVLSPVQARGDAAAAAVHVQPRTPLAGAYRAQVTAVIDGDTVEARIHVWMGQEAVTRIRLAGIDAPEMGGACAAEQQLARRARERLAALVQPGAVVITDVRPDKYFGRVVARLLLADGRDAGDILVQEELVRAGHRRFSWC